MAWLAVWLVLSLTSAETGQISERLIRAEQLKDDLEYEAARQELLDVIADPRASEDELLRAHMSAGEIARVMERDVDARMHFLYVLSRKPDMVMPDDRPPKIRTFFELLRQEVRDRDARDAALAGRAVESAPEATPSSSEKTRGTPYLAIAGGGVLALGVVGLGSALVLAGFGELIYADRSRPVDERELAQSIAIAGWGLLVLASIPVVVGGGLVVVDFLRE
jgi:hypothetical protein